MPPETMLKWRFRVAMLRAMYIVLRQLNCPMNEAKFLADLSGEIDELIDREKG